MSRTAIGRVILEDSNGKPRYTVLWSLPPALRTLELVMDDGVYAAQRQTPEGQWVYRHVRGRGDLLVDEYLSECHCPGDADWDGPPATPLPIPTWKDCQYVLEVMVKDSARNKGLIHASSVLAVIPLLKAAFEKMPYTPPAPKPVGKPARPSRDPGFTPTEVSKERAKLSKFSLDPQ
jgi:hypothetical protein